MEKPGVLIVDVAKKESAAYVVMGTRGLGKIRRTIMGSVSDYVVHHCHCPVIVCRKWANEYQHQGHKSHLKVMYYKIAISP